MYGANAQNTLIRLREELTQCSYNQNMKDYLANLIMSIMNYPKKRTQVRHFIKYMNQNKIIMIWYPMSVPFSGNNYDVPLQIYIMKNVPYEPPQIFLEVVQGSAANTSNKDIDPNNNRIMTNSLRNWSQYSIIDNVMNEIYSSFCRVFPIYKKKSTNNFNPPPPQVVPPSGGGNIYGQLVNEVKNMYQQNNGGLYGFQPPTKNIYGRAMSIETNNNNNYNNNQQPPNPFGGGGIYGNNNYNNNQQPPNPFGGGGIYGNNNNNQQPPNQFCGGGGIYGNNNNNNQQPNSFGGGIYGNNNNNNNQQQPSSFGGGIYGNNNNNQQPNSFGGGIYDQPRKNPDEEFKEILMAEVTSKISNKLISEKQRLNSQNQKMNNQKTIFKKENEKLQSFVNGQNFIKKRCDEDMYNMENALNRIKEQINRSKNMVLNEENCINLIEVQDPNAIKAIASETSMEEMILIVRKGFERKKVSFDEAIRFMRNSTRDLFAIKFLKDKMVNKYRY